MQWTQRADREATGTTTFYQQVTLFDVREHNSGQFVWVLMETHVYNCNYSMRFSLIFSYGPA